MLLARVLLCIFCGLAWAQQDANIDSPAGESSAGPAPSETDGPSGEAAKDMTMEDIRVNFATVVENFITAHSPKGYWPLKQKTTGRILRFKLDRVDEKSVRQVSPGRYSGRVRLRRVDAEQLHQAEFVVDLTGESWRVERLLLLPGSLPAPKSRKPAPSS